MVTQNPAHSPADTPLEIYAAAESFYAGDFNRAMELAQISMDISPCPEAYAIIAGVRDARGERRQAVALYRKGLSLFPDDPGLVINLARSLRRMSGRAPEAVKLLTEAVQRAPSFAPARLSLIETLRTAAGRLDQAEAQACSYIDLFPHDPDGYLALALILFNRGRHRAAIDAADRCISLNGNMPRALELKASAFIQLGSAAGALACYRAYIAERPDAEIHSRALVAMQYCDTVTEEDISAATCDWVRIHADGITRRSSWPGLQFDPAKPLTVGIISGDFRRCSTISLARPVLDHLPAEWPLIFYANVECTDGGTELFRSFCDRWVDLCGLSDDAAAARIAADGVDVLIDLNGHLLGGRPGVLARKPAPVQVAWLDYVGTTGLTAMDGIIADAAHLPVTDQRWYPEPILHVTDNLYRYAPPSNAPPVAPLPALRNGYMTFGCFNSAYKLSDTTLNLWAEILRRVPTARLLLNAPEYKHSDTRQRFADLLGALGVDSHRIEFRAGAPDPMGMLEAYGDVDVALDPMPYSGGLTTIEALFMGVPVVTLPGSRFGARHAGVHLRSVGLEDWIADDRQSYVALAIGTGMDLERLAVLRGRLRSRVEQSCLMDGASLAADISDLLRKLWVAACARGPSSE